MIEEQDFETVLSWYAKTYGCEDVKVGRYCLVIGPNPIGIYDTPDEALARGKFLGVDSTLLAVHQLTQAHVDLVMVER